MNNNDNAVAAVLRALQHLQTIRQQAHRMLTLAREGRLQHFTFADERMPATATFVLEVIYDQYPALDIPYHSRWRHFEAGGINRIKELSAQLDGLSEEEQGKILVELVIISVLLDAGAGQHWRYIELETRQEFSRSEGLALASLALYLSGAFSAFPDQPLRADAECLLTFSQASLMRGFQVSSTNSLEGIEGRTRLLNRLGKTVKKDGNYFGKEGRLGNFYSYLISMQDKQSLSVDKIFQAVLPAFSEVWPERLQYKGIPLGDVWIHQALKTEVLGSEFIPFHKLSQWLTYSLIEPLEQFGLQVTDLDDLTGLAEYRNGGLLIDLGLLRANDEQIFQYSHAPDSEIIVEWRALTVAVLDELANTIRQQLKMSASQLPLAKILQGGTWEAGRRAAKQKRRDGSPPIQIISDGTIF
jgi:Protein of unknown function (DUF1688)